MAATATLSPVEDPSPNPAATPPVWDRGGPLQQVAYPAPDSCQTGSVNTGVGTTEDLRLPRRRPPPGYLWSFLGESHAFGRTQVVQDKESPYIPLGGGPHHVLSISSVCQVWLQGGTKPIQPFQAVYSNSSWVGSVQGFGNGGRSGRKRVMTPIYPAGKQIPCSSPGCCLSFPSVRDLAQHLRTHCPPTQSLEGKIRAADSEADRQTAG